MAKKISFPKVAWIYVCDYDENGKPIFAAVKGHDDLPDGGDGEEIAIYKLTGIKRLKVKKELV